MKNMNLTACGKDNSTSLTSSDTHVLVQHLCTAGAIVVAVAAAFHAQRMVESFSMTLVAGVTTFAGVRLGLWLLFLHLA